MLHLFEDPPPHPPPLQKKEEKNFRFLIFLTEDLSLTSFLSYRNIPIDYTLRAVELKQS